jgi:hypothetical protein
MILKEISKEYAKKLLDRKEAGLLTKFTITDHDKEYMIIDLFNFEGRLFLVKSEELGIEQNGVFTFSIKTDKIIR